MAGASPGLPAASRAARSGGHGAACPLGDLARCSSKARRKPWPAAAKGCGHAARGGSNQYGGPRGVRSGIPSTTILTGRPPVLDPMRLLVLAALALSPILAGCVQPPEPPAGLLSGADAGAGTLGCFLHDNATVCNFEATTTNERGNEVTVTVNPTDPLNIVAGAKDYTAEHTGGNCVWDGVYVTKDGGKTWKNYNIPGSPWLLVTNRDKFEMTPSSQYWCATDPVVRFGPDGTLYYSVMNYQGDPVTASPTGKEATCALQAAGVPLIGCTGVNDVAFNRVAQIVYVSEDGGETFSYASVVDFGTFPVNFHDRQWIDVGPDDAVYVAWTSGFAMGNMVYVSHDKARTWEGPVFLEGPGSEALFLAQAVGAPVEQPFAGSLFVAAGPPGIVYISGESFDGANLLKSTDGGKSFSTWTHVACEADDGMEATYRGGGVARVVASHTTDRVAIVCVDTRNGDRDVWVAVSEDGGTTWGEELRVNDDEVANGVDQFMASLSMSPSGILDAVWYDRRDDPDATLLDLYHSRSLDGGKTWSRNFRVTEVSSDPEHSKHQGGFTFMGDYIDIASTETAAVPVWVDTRLETADVFVAQILQPGKSIDFDAGISLAEPEHGH